MSTLVRLGSLSEHPDTAGQDCTALYCGIDWIYLDSCWEQSAVVVFGPMEVALGGSAL